MPKEKLLWFLPDALTIALLLVLDLSRSRGALNKTHRDLKLAFCVANKVVVQLWTKNWVITLVDYSWIGLYFWRHFCGVVWLWYIFVVFIDTAGENESGKFQINISCIWLRYLKKQICFLYKI